MRIPFSTRSLQEDSPNALTRALAEARTRGPVLDLTVSNPTTAGIAYDENAILGAFSDRAMLAYEPQPVGLASARAAVAKEIGWDAERIALTASTSEAYAV